jgi:hypothetical protein
VSGWNDLFLGTIAVSTLVMALIQVGAIIVVSRLGKQAQETLASVQRDLKPLLAKANAIADEASRTAALASAQVQKVDWLVTDLSRRVDQTASIVQEAIVTPAREGFAIVAGVRAALVALRSMGGLRGAPTRTEEDDALFIG